MTASDVTTAVERVSLSEADHAVIRRCIDRQPKLFMRGQHEGYYVHSDVSDLIDMVGRLSAALGEIASWPRVTSYPNTYRGGFDAATTLAGDRARTALQQQEN